MAYPSRGAWHFRNQTRGVVEPESWKHNGTRRQGLGRRIWHPSRPAGPARRAHYVTPAPVLRQAVIDAGIAAAAPVSARRVSEHVTGPAHHLPLARMVAILEFRGVVEAPPLLDTQQLLAMVRLHPGEPDTGYERDQAAAIRETLWGLAADSLIDSDLFLNQVGSYVLQMLDLARYDETKNIMAVLSAIGEEPTDVAMVQNVLAAMRPAIEAHGSYAPYIGTLLDELVPDDALVRSNALKVQTDLRASVRRLVEPGPLAHVVTVDVDGTPRVSPEWVGVEDDEVVIGILFDQATLRNVRRDASVTLSMTDGSRDDWGRDRYVVLRGRARVTEGGAADLLQRLARTYLGRDVRFPMTDPPPGWVIRIAVERISHISFWQGEHSVPPTP